MLPLRVPLRLLPLEAVPSHPRRQCARVPPSALPHPRLFLWPSQWLWVVWPCGGPWAPSPWQCSPPLPGVFLSFLMVTGVPCASQSPVHVTPRALLQSVWSCSGPDHGGSLFPAGCCLHFLGDISTAVGLSLAFHSAFRQSGDSNLC